MKIIELPSRMGSEILLNFDSEKEKIDLINNINDQINKIGF